MSGYGFKDFKLKGGVLAGDEEMEAIVALHEALPRCAHHPGPQRGWSLRDAIRAVPGQDTACWPTPKTRAAPKAASPAAR
jgi:L-alanine-DL-glutamate epimerase-like enolase superfamily enzyme